jgi:hypothetical protein
MAVSVTGATRFRVTLVESGRFNFAERNGLRPVESADFLSAVFPERCHSGQGLDWRVQVLP